MLPELKAAWIAAMESGEFMHTKNMFERAPSHSYPSIKHCCCLGVLLNVVVERGMYDVTKQFDPNSGMYRFHYTDHRLREPEGCSVTGILDLYLCDELGIDHETMMTLVQINDAYYTCSYKEQIEAIKALV